MPTQQPIDREKFIKRLRRSGLLSTDQFQQVYDLAAGNERGRDLAKTLVAKGVLTRFQAEMLLAGRVDGFLLGQYRVLDQIGRGGMGRVYKAEHITMNRVVALKVLSNALTRTERARQLFQREVRAAAKLVHPNIVTAYDANEADGRLYLVMEYVDGQNLQELVQERGPMDVGQACEFIRQAALGLQYANEMGMVHRDIKPANLLVHRGTSQTGRVVKILDFGLARLNDPKLTKLQGKDSLPAVEQAVMGTPDFLSPEQAKNLHNVDIRADLYSLGCTFFYLLTGQVPFPGGTALEKLVRHGSEAVTPIVQLRPDVAPEVSAIVARLMAKDPEERFQTPIDVAQALAPFAVAAVDVFPGSGPVAGEGGVPASPWAEIMDTPDRSAAAGTLPGGILITPTASTASFLYQRQQARKSRPRWVLPAAIVAGAIILGFALGATVLKLLR